MDPRLCTLLLLCLLRRLRIISIVSPSPWKTVPPSPLATPLSLPHKCATLLPFPQVRFGTLLSFLARLPPLNTPILSTSLKSLHTTHFGNRFSLPTVASPLPLTTPLFSTSLTGSVPRVHFGTQVPTAIIPIVLRSNRSRSPMGPPTLMCPLFTLLRSILRMSNLSSLSRRAACPGTVTGRPTVDTGTITRRVVLTLAGLIILYPPVDCRWGCWRRNFLFRL